MSREHFRKYLPVFVLAVILSGCAVKELTPEGWRASDIDQRWPESPAPARIELLRVVGKKTDLEEPGGGGRILKWLLGDNIEEQPLISPYGVSADGFGRTWVADTGGGGVKVFDLARRSVGFIGQAGSLPLVAPVDVAYDFAGQGLYVADSGLKKVFRFDLEGQYQSTIEPESGFGRPAGLAIGPEGRLYVVDVKKGVIEVFSPQGQHLRSVGSAAAENGLFNHPSNVAVDGKGRLYVVDSLRFRIEVQDSGGALLSVIGGIGDSPGRFARPRGIAVDSSGHIYVADAAFDNIQIFDLAGELLLYIGEPGKGPGQFCLPAGLFIDQKDRIYVAEACNQRFQIFQYLVPAAQ